MSSTARMPRVLVATNMYPSATKPARGAFVAAQVDALREMDVPVDVFHFEADHQSSAYLRAVGALQGAVRRFMPDVVYAFYGLTGWVALWQPRPLVLSLAGDDVLGTPAPGGGRTLKSRVGVALSNAAAARARVVCVQSDQMRERLWTRSLRRRALVVPYGVDPRRFSPGDRGAARRRLGLPLDRRLVIFPNTPTEPRKRLDLAQGAMAIVRRSYPDAELRIVSGVPHAAMPDYYRAADCLLLTSDWEGSPNVVKEALLAGLPVVTTEVGDVQRWIPLSPESSIVSREPAGIAAGVERVLATCARTDPTPFVQGFSSRAITERMLALCAEAAFGRGESA